MGGDRQHIERYLQTTADRIRSHDVGEVGAVLDMLYDAYENDRQILTCGNGGSAATASHFAVDLQKGTRPATPKRFRALCLADNIPSVTAWGNDESYDSIFARQLESLAAPGDVLVCFSVSGTSKNVVNAAERARELGCRVAGLTGKAGDVLRGVSDASVTTPDTDVEMVEDAHMALVHVFVSGLRRRIRGA